MKNKWSVIGAAGFGILLGAAGASAHSYNPLKWIKKPTASQQLAAGELNEVIRAIRAGVAYANVHTTLSTSGEIRGQIRTDDDD